MPPATEPHAHLHRWSRAGVCGGLALGVLGTPAHAEWEIAATAGAFYDDNLTRAQDSVDKRAAGAATANLNGTNFIPLTGSDGVTFTVNSRFEVFERYSGLSNIVIGGAAAYRHKFGLGYTAPWLSLTVGASFDDYHEDLRTSTRLDLRAVTGTRFTEQFDVSAGVYYERRYDSHGESIVPGISGHVFDLAGQGAYIRGGYAPTNALYFDAKAGVRRGDVESTSQRSRQIFLASSAIANDPVWGDPALFAYRLRGTTWSGALTSSYALSDQSSLDGEYHYEFTRAAQGLEYTSNRIAVLFVHRF